MVQAGPFPKKIIPADAEWTVHMNLSRFTATRLYDLLMKEEEAGKIVKKSETFQKKFKIDVFKDIKDITIYGLEKGEKNAVV
jgi:hypothetical protein